MNNNILCITFIISLSIGIGIFLYSVKTTKNAEANVASVKASEKASANASANVNVRVATANIPQGPQPTRQPPQIAWQCVPGIMVPISTNTEGEILGMGNNEGTKPRWVKSFEECQTLVKNMNGVDPWFFYETAITCPDSENMPEWCRLAKKLIAAQPSGPSGKAVGT